MASDKENKKMSDNEVFDDFVTVTPIKRSRAEFVDFTIICKDKDGKVVKYGSEKAVLANSCTFFADLFEYGSPCKQDQEIEMVDFKANVILKCLYIVSGIVEKDTWALDTASDVIDFGHKYKSDIIMTRGLSQFLRSFIHLALDNEPYRPKDTRFRKGALIKYMSLWRRGYEGDLCWSSDIEQQYYWNLAYVAKPWFKKCGLNITTASPIDLIEYDTWKYLSAEDITDFCLFFQKYSKENLTDKDLQAFLDALKVERQKAESTAPQ